MSPTLHDADQLGALISPRPPSSFSQAAPALVAVIDGTGPAWARGLLLPSYALSTEPPANPSLTHRFMPLSRDAVSPVLPSLFMPGFPKCATTSLYECLLATFAPARLGCGERAAGWSATACKRRFLLAPLETRARGQFEERKETFFFGGSAATYFQPDLMALHGPNPRTGQLAHEPPLWAWEAMQREKWPRGLTHKSQPLRLASLAAICENNTHGPQVCLAPSRSDECHRLHKRASARGRQREKQAVPASALAPLCSTTGVASRTAVQATPDGLIPGVGPRSCTHPGCMRIAQLLPKSWNGKCKWDSSVNGDRATADLYCLSSMVPWVGEDELNATVIDFTPNYMCDPAALSRILATAKDPAALRFVVVMRDPVMRAFSEWSMFTNWGWDPSKTFTSSLLIELRRLRKCNTTLYQNAQLLRSLPTPELATYLRKCFRSGQAMMYVETSMYAVCVEHALRHFRREQFLFLRYEDLMRMDRTSVVALVARFAGLDADVQLLRNASAHGKCSFGAVAATGRKPSSYSSGSIDSAEQLAAAAPHLERLFDPYNTLLAEIVHPAFRWHASDHTKTPLDAAQKAQFLLSEAREKAKSAKCKAARITGRLALERQSKAAHIANGSRSFYSAFYRPPARQQAGRVHKLEPPGKRRTDRHRE